MHRVTLPLGIAINCTELHDLLGTTIFRKGPVPRAACSTLYSEITRLKDNRRLPFISLPWNVERLSNYADKFSFLLSRVTRCGIAEITKRCVMQTVQAIRQVV